MSKNFTLFHHVQTSTTVRLGGLAAGTTVLTLEGEMPVEQLHVGDRIITRAGARSLRALRASVLDDAAMIRISASALGVERPEEDMIVAADQLILIRDWRARALKGTEKAVVTAQELVDGEYIRAETISYLHLYKLEFDRPEVIYANGVELACANI